MSLVIRCTAVLLCLALFLPPPSNAATDLELEQFRADFGIFLDEMSALGPQARSINDRAMQPVFESLDQARVMLDEADAEALASMREAMARSPQAWDVPGLLAGRLTLATRNARETIGIKANPALCADDSGQAQNCVDCPAQTAMGVKDEIITNSIVLAMEGVWAVISDGMEIPIPIIGGCIRTPHPGKVILGIAMYAVKAIELGIQTANAYNGDCESDYRDRVSNFNLDDTITSRASAAAVAALLQSIFDFQAEALRFDIEANMVGESSRTAISLFQLPEHHGGYLETVRGIVVEAIEELETPGDHMADARRYLTMGDTNYGSEKWVEAYESYRAAYRIAVSNDPSAARRRLR